MNMETRSLRALLVLVAALVLAAGCGVANPFAPAASKSSNQELALKWAQCMRSHGVNVPDPNSNGQIQIRSTAAPAGSGSGDTGTGTGTGTQPKGPDDPTFQAAQNACKQYQPGGAQGNGRPSQQQIDAMTKFAQCMRDHGIPMQDPQTSGGGVRIGSGPGGPDPNSDQFKQAQSACQHFMDQAKPKGSGG
jgi:hypothetical protein